MTNDYSPVYMQHNAVSTRVDRQHEKTASDLWHIFTF